MKPKKSFIAKLVGHEILHLFEYEILSSTILRLCVYITSFKSTMKYVIFNQTYMP